MQGETWVVEREDDSYVAGNMVGNIRPKNT